jgi:elongation factor P
MQYLYKEGDLYYFMNVENYEQISLTADQCAEEMKFCKENEMVKMLSHDGEVFNVEPPLFADLEVTDTEPGFKGNTATGATKPAIVETGAQVNVPLFVNKGEKIQIDTRTGEYLKRV